MSRRALIACLPVLALASAGTAALPAQAALETVVQDDAQLLHRPAERVTASVARLKALGVDRVRLTASWSSLTRDADSETRPVFDARDPAAYEQARWRGLDNAVRTARAAGLKVLVDVGFWAPHWATTDPPGPRARANIDPGEYAQFAAAVARRYSGGFVAPADDGTPAPSQDAQLLDGLLGMLPLGAPAAASAAGDPLPAVDQLALYNEPNHQALLLPQWNGTSRSAQPASPAVYRAMVAAAYPAVKAVRPSTRVLIGNTSSTGGTPGQGPVAPLRFLRELACVDRRLRLRTGGACAGFQPIPGDGWAHHPYAQNQRPDKRSSGRNRDDVKIADLPVLARTLNRLVAMGRMAPGVRAIHLTEFGYETHPVRGRPRVSQSTQSRWLTWAEYLADRVPTVTSFAQFLLRDQAPAGTKVSDSSARPQGEFFSGLQESDGRDKLAARSFVAGLFAQRRAHGRVLLWGRLRLGRGAKRIAVQRRVGRGAWRTVARATVDGQGTFERQILGRTGARYRLVHPSAGAGRVAERPIAAVPATRRR